MSNETPADPAKASELELHPKTAGLVNSFARALAEKLASAEAKYGYSDGWASPDWMDECRAHLVEHVAKGDPRDVAAYCAFLWFHGERTKLTASELAAAPAAEGETMRDWSARMAEVEAGKYVGAGSHGIDDKPESGQREWVEPNVLDAIMRARGLPKVADALGYSRNFAAANPMLSQTTRDHIEGLCNMLEIAAAHAAKQAGMADTLERMSQDYDTTGRVAEAESLRMAAMLVRREQQRTGSRGEGE